MDFIVLSRVSGILKPIAWFFGVIFNWLYELLSLMGIENIAITLVLFTIIVKMILLPLTIKQQRSAKLTSIMQPELQAIADKYKGRKDEQSLRLQQMEQQEVYQKYGSSPMAGCLPILIQFPIIFGMYKIIYAIPAYVTKIGNIYNDIVTRILSQDGAARYLLDTASSVRVSTNKWEGVSEGLISKEHAIDILTNFGTDQWNSLLSSFPALNIPSVTEAIDKIDSIFSVFGLKILNSPKYYAGVNGFFNIALLVPVLAVVTQLASSLLSKIQNKTPKNKKQEDNAMAQSMNTMLYVMPFMSGIFCYSFSLVVGIYWIINTVVSVIQQMIINAYIEKSDMDAYIAKNVEKQKKKLEKLGVSSNSTYMSELAKRQTKSIDYRQPVKVNTTASYANIGSSSSGKKNDKSEKSQSESGEDSTEIRTKEPVTKSISSYANILKRD